MAKMDYRNARKYSGKSSGPVCGCVVTLESQMERVAGFAKKAKEDGDFEAFTKWTTEHARLVEMKTGKKVDVTAEIKRSNFFKLAKEEAQVDDMDLDELDAYICANAKRR